MENKNEQFNCQSFTLLILFSLLSMHAYIKIAWVNWNWLCYKSIPASAFGFICSINMYLVLTIQLWYKTVQKFVTDSWYLFLHCTYWSTKWSNSYSNPPTNLPSKMSNQNSVRLFSIVKMINNHPMVYIILHSKNDSLRPILSTIHPAITVPTRAPTGNKT